MDKAQKCPVCDGSGAIIVPDEKPEPSAKGNVITLFKGVRAAGVPVDEALKLLQAVFADERDYYERQLSQLRREGGETT